MSEAAFREHTRNLPPDLKSDLYKLCYMDVSNGRNRLHALWLFGEFVAVGTIAATHIDPQGTPICTRAIAAKLMGVDEHFLDLVAELYQAFPTEQAIERLAGLRLNDGRPLLWDHLWVLLELLPSTGAEQRRNFNHWLRKTIELNWSPASLRTAIRKALHPRPRRGKRAADQSIERLTFEQSCQRLQSQGEYFCRNLQQLHLSAEFGILATLRAMPARAIWEQRAAIQEQLDKMRQVSKQLTEHLQKLEEHCEAGQSYVDQMCSQAEAAKVQAQTAGPSDKTAATPVRR